MFDPHHVNTHSKRRGHKGQIIQQRLINPPITIEHRLIPIYRDYLIKNNLLPPPPSPSPATSFDLQSGYPSKLFFLSPINPFRMEIELGEPTIHDFTLNSTNSWTSVVTIPTGPIISLDIIAAQPQDPIQPLFQTVYYSMCIHFSHSKTIETRSTTMQVLPPYRAPPLRTRGHLFHWNLDFSTLYRDVDLRSYFYNFGEERPPLYAFMVAFDMYYSNIRVHSKHITYNPFLQFLPKLITYTATLVTFSNQFSFNEIYIPTTLSVPETITIEDNQV